MSQIDRGAARAQMERWYWWGILTFFRSPWNEVPGAGDIALTGIPRPSNGSTERDRHPHHDADARRAPA